MSCPDCTQAAITEWHGFRADCEVCKARAMARSPQFRRCRDAGAQDRAYRQMLQQFGLTHEQVRTAAQADVQCRREAEAAKQRRASA
jgi:hypothetical protein